MSEMQTMTCHECRSSTNSNLYSEREIKNATEATNRKNKWKIPEPEDWLGRDEDQVVPRPHPTSDVAGSTPPEHRSVRRYTWETENDRERSINVLGGAQLQDPPKTVLHPAHLLSLHIWRVVWLGLAAHVDRAFEHGVRWSSMAMGRVLLDTDVSVRSGRRGDRGLLHRQMLRLVHLLTGHEEAHQGLARWIVLRRDGRGLDGAVLGARSLDALRVGGGEGLAKRFAGVSIELAGGNAGRRVALHLRTPGLSLSLSLSSGAAQPGEGAAGLRRVVGRGEGPS